MRLLPNCHFFTTNSAIFSYINIANVSQKCKFTTTT